MKLTVNEALLLLEQARIKSNDERFINHSICVGNTAGIIAESLQLDVDYAKTLGYLHDIGKQTGISKQHPINGYHYIKSLGYGDEYAAICLTHSYLNNDVFCTAGGVPKEDSFVVNYIKEHEYTIYEKIVNLCDLMCTDKVMTIDKRLVDLIIRKGAHENTQYHIKETYKLKAYLDEQVGYNIYKLFPEIIENL